MSLTLQTIEFRIATRLSEIFLQRGEQFLKLETPKTEFKPEISVEKKSSAEPKFFVMEQR